MFLQNSINILFKYHGLNESTDMVHTSSEASQGFIFLKILSLNLINY